ncbi:MAG: PAS domain S-box protein [Desulfamplus sp.]
MAEKTTNHKQIKEELRVSVIKHKTILEALPVGVTISDDAENIVESNEAAQKMLGLSRKEHLKRKIQGNDWNIIREDGSPMPPEEFPSVRALKERSLIENVVMGIVKEDNEVTWISVSSTPVPLEGYGVVIAFSDITERKRTEEKYLTLFREMLDGFALHEIICDENGKPTDYKFLTVNPAFERITGLKAVDIVDKRVLEVLPDIEKYWIEIYGKVAITGEPAFFENYSDELKKHFEVKAFRPAYGQFACIISDITKRKQIEHSLYESEARFKALHNASFGGITIHDKGVILDCNQGLSAMTGYSVSELTGMDGLLLIAEKSRHFVMQNILSGYEKPYEAVGLRKNGEEYPLRLEARNIPYKGKNVRVVEFRDITEQKKTEERLRQRSEELKVVLDAIPAFIWIGKDPECRVITGNQYVNELFGIMPETNVSQTAVKLNQDAFAIKHLKANGTEYKTEELPMQQSIALGKAVSNQELSYLLPDGRRIYVLGNALPLFDDKGAIRGSVGVFLDITEKKQAEIKQKELEAANLRLQKAESLAQMAGGIAHLFNNYLYAVSGNLELALEMLPDDSLIRDNLTEAMKAARRCSDVSGSMLTYLGQSVVRAESIDISEFCRMNLPDFQSSVHDGITIETDITDTELIVRVNSNQMQQVLNHLITNACESIGENKGIINLITKTIPASDISKFHLFPVDSKPSSDTYACLEVTDTGCGILKDDIDKLFDPFFTTKFTGRGLGLAVVSGIVKSWGGMIGVRSKVGHGSSFMVFIPLSNDTSVLQSKKLSQSSQPQQKESSTVLLVEDHEMVRNMTTVMLKRIGFEVISAVNGVEAVELFRKHKESVSCLITDLSMPELDGWGTLAEIRKIKPDIPAILASGYDEGFAMSRDNSEKPQAFLHKPYTMKDLKGALGQALLL